MLSIQRPIDRDSGTSPLSAILVVSNTFKPLSNKTLFHQRKFPIPPIFLHSSCPLRRPKIRDGTVIVNKPTAHYSKIIKLVAENFVDTEKFRMAFFISFKNTKFEGRTRGVICKFKFQKAEAERLALEIDQVDLQELHL